MEISGGDEGWCLNKIMAIPSDDYNVERFLISEGSGGDGEMVGVVTNFTSATSSSMSRTPPPRLRIHLRPCRLWLLRPGERSVSYMRQIISQTTCSWVSSSSSEFPASDSSIMKNHYYNALRNLSMVRPPQGGSRC